MKLSTGFGAVAVAGLALWLGRPAPAPGHEAWRDTARRMDLRWAGLAEEGRPLDAELPIRERWEACMPLARAVTDCPDVLAAALEVPPPDAARGYALVQAIGAPAFRAGRDPGERALHLVGWGPPPLPTVETLQAWAVATATMLGGSGDGTASVAGLEQVRRQLLALCGDCAPATGDIQPPDPLASAALDGERLARQADPDLESASPLAQVVARVRRQEPLPPEVWQTPGLCGMAALELARAGRGLDEILDAAVHGPTESDRLAALHAALRLADPESWEPGEARERATRLAEVAG